MTPPEMFEAAQAWCRWYAEATGHPFEHAVNILRYFLLTPAPDGWPGRVMKKVMESE